jgi:hypothetical protein
MREDGKRIGFPWHLQDSGDAEWWNSDIAAFAGIRMFNHDTTSSDPAFRSGQLCWIESEFFAGAAHQARVKDLVRMAERNFGPSVFSMHRDHDRTLMPLITLAVIDAAALLNELLSKCIAFHYICSRRLSDLAFIPGCHIDLQFLADASHRAGSSRQQSLNFIPW